MSICWCSIVIKKRTFLWVTVNTGWSDDCVKYFQCNRVCVCSTHCVPYSLRAFKVSRSKKKSIQCVQRYNFYAMYPVYVLLLKGQSDEMQSEKLSQFLGSIWIHGSMEEYTYTVPSSILVCSHKTHAVFNWNYIALNCWMKRTKQKNKNHFLCCSYWCWWCRCYLHIPFRMYFICSTL